MALPYKLFKSLEIDGITMGIDPDIGSRIAASKRLNIPTANTWIDGPEITVNEAGLYLLSSIWYFGTASTTGIRNVCIQLAYSNAGAAYATSHGVGCSTTLNTRLVFVWPLRVKESDIPAKFKITAWSDKTSSSNGEAAIGVMKLLDEIGRW